MDRMREFRNLFASLADQYPSLKDKVHREIVSERWSIEYMYDWRPFCKEFGFVPGRWLPDEPESRVGKIRYQFDAQKRPALVTWFQEDPYGERYREDIHSYERDRHLICTFETDKTDQPPSCELVCLESYEHGENGVTCRERLNFLGAPDGDYERYEYSYSDGRIVGVREQWHFAGEWWVTRWKAYYDSRDRVQRIVQVEGGDEIRPYSVIYVRRFKTLHKLQSMIVMWFKIFRESWGDTTDEPQA